MPGNGSVFIDGIVPLAAPARGLFRPHPRASQAVDVLDGCVILVLRSLESPYLPHAESCPVDRAGQSLQPAAGTFAEDSGSIIATRDEGLYDRDFQSTGFFGEGFFVALLFFKLQVNPRHEQHVPQPGLDRARA